MEEGVNSSLGLADSLDYVILSGYTHVQSMLDILHEEGVYELYRTKKYKHLTKEALYGVYFVVLANIRLHRLSRKSKSKEHESIQVLNDYKEKPLYTITVNKTYDVLSLGEEHLYEFLAHVVRMYVKEYRYRKTTYIVPDYSRDARGVDNKYPAHDIIYLFVTLRHYYGRYAGQKEFDVMIEGMIDEFNNYESRDKHDIFNVKMLAYEVQREIERGIWWKKLRQDGVRLKEYEYGFTDRDKRNIIGTHRVWVKR